MLAPDRAVAHRRLRVRRLYSLEGLQPRMRLRRMLTVVNQFSRQIPLIEVRFGFGARDFAAAPDRIIAYAGTLLTITVDHGTEFISIEDVRDQIEH